MSEVIHNILKSKSVYFAWSAAALFYFYQYILRVSPGVMHHEIRTEFLLSAHKFATLGSLYLLAYSLLQIPLGILMDRFGARRVILVSIILCSSGAFMFYCANSLMMMQAARFLTGIGSGAAFMGALKIAADNLPPGNRGIILGLTLTLGIMGALFSGNIVSSALLVVEWRDIWFYLALLGAFVFIFAWIGINKSVAKSSDASSKKSFSASNVLADTVVVLKNPIIMLYAFLSIGLYAPLSVLADLMGIAFMEQKLSVSNVISAQTTMKLYLGLGIGSILVPFICEKFNIMNRGIQFCAFGILISFSILLYWPGLSLHGTQIILLIIGILCGSEMLCFTAALRFADNNNSGIIIGVINTMNMLGGAILEQSVGWLLDIQWNNIYDINNVRVYSVHNFVVTFSSLIVVVLICVCITFSLKKYGR